MNSLYNRSDLVADHRILLRIRHRVCEVVIQSMSLFVHLPLLFQEGKTQGELFTGPNTLRTVDIAKAKKHNLVVDISGNILHTDAVRNNNADAPSSIFDAIIAKLQVCCFYLLRLQYLIMDYYITSLLSQLKRVRVKCCDISRKASTQESRINIPKTAFLSQWITWQRTRQTLLNFPAEIAISITNDI